MLTTSGSGPISSIGPAKTYYTRTERESHTSAAQGPQYDSVSLSSLPEGKSRFHMDMVSRLSQEIRTSTTTGDIQALRQQVASGTYTPDPMAIAARILFLSEEA